jgi:L-aminopeptidase/D-esterase-like protein
MANSEAPGHPLPGVLVGHDTDDRRPTGVTVVLLPEGTTAGVDVRGAAPGTRETDLLDPVATVQEVHAIALCGGSAFGLDAAGGVMRWLEAQGRGFEVGPVRVPLVPAAVVFDLGVGDPAIRPDADSGARACAAAVPVALAAEGNVGAGAGASVGKLLGPDRAMRGGVGIATVHAQGFTMSAVVVVNAVGDVVDPDTGAVLAGARVSPDSLELAGAVGEVLAGRYGDSPAGASPGGVSPGGANTTIGANAGGAHPDGANTTIGANAGGAHPDGANTTIGVLVTDALLTKAQVARLAQVGHDGLAHTIRPVHTPMDGDTLFAAATGSVDPQVQQAIAPHRLALLLSVMATEATSRAVLRAIRAADGLRLEDLWLPSWGDRTRG